MEVNRLLGTIIDLETIGPIRNEFRDTRRYEKVRPYLFGYLTGNAIVQKYVEKSDHIPQLVQCDYGDAPKIISFYSSMSEYPFSDAIRSPRRALILTAGCEILSFGARSAIVNPNSLTAQ